VRWDKNNLKIIRLLLERRPNFAMYGGVRFGGTLTIDDAFARGFDHVALCLGAGRPTIVAMENGLAHGVRQASDFLMALQLTGAAKSDSVANLTVRLPIVVIGGGLTAIDTATEALAYYPVQVEKFLARYERLKAALGYDVIHWDDDEAAIAAEFVAHAKALRNERAAAAKEGRLPRLAALLESWGGATVVYRRPEAEKSRPPGRAGSGDASRTNHSSGGRHPAEYSARPRRFDQCAAGRKVFSGIQRERPSGAAGAYEQTSHGARADE
jgi:hypothetical protein